MKKYSKEEIEQLISDYVDLEIKIESIVERMAEMKMNKIEGNLIGIEFYNDKVLAKYESSEYMNYEIHYHEFPVEYLYNENWEAKLAEIIKEAQERIKKAQEQNKINTEFLERKEYERLKAKFEDKC